MIREIIDKNLKSIFSNSEIQLNEKQRIWIDQPLKIVVIFGRKTNWACDNYKEEQSDDRRWIMSP